MPRNFGFSLESSSVVEPGKVLGNSSVVEQEAVNFLGAGSNPASPAKDTKKRAKKNPYLMKLIGLRYHYGRAAQDHFSEHPSCEDCGEERIATLTVHHVHGKNVDIFRTLCFNCHMLEHSSSPDFTYSDHQKLLHKKETARQVFEARIDEMVRLKKAGLSLRAIGRELKICYVSVKIYLDRRGALQ